MTSRYFTMPAGHFPNENKFVEVDESGEMWSHTDSGGRDKHNRDAARKSALDGCLLYVKNGTWIEVFPFGREWAYGDHW